MHPPLLSATSLVVELGGTRGRRVRALDRVSLTIRRGEVVVVVGESGSGKTTLLRALAGLVRPTAGEIRLDGVPLAELARAQRRRYHRAVQIVFQDPYASLNARHSIRRVLGQPLRVHRGLKGREAEAAMVELLEQVGLDATALERRPAAFSGGQRQRIAIARSLTVEPELLLLDEPLSALDDETAHQLSLLLERLRRERGLTFAMVSHDLAVARELAHDLVVLRDGVVVEQGTAADVLAAPSAAYTHELLAASGA